LPHLTELVGFTGAYETIRTLRSSSQTYHTAGELETVMQEHDVDSPDSAIEDLVAGSILCRQGDSYRLTTLGLRTGLLMDAVNGGDLNDIFRRLGALDGNLRRYELVRHGMTSSFLRSLVVRPGFGRLYLCSPWINLDKADEDTLFHAVTQAHDRRGSRPEILVITRPEQGTQTVLPDSVQVLERLGATFYLHSRLHTKLYIREPDMGGGYAMAILGSQNLTRSKYLELGIRIRCDSQMIGQLIKYYLELTFRCHESR
jgi:hypothetical protein